MADSSTSFTWRGPTAVAIVREAGPRATLKAAERLRAVSVPRAPIDYGPLRGSAGTQQGTVEDPTALVFYDTPYAVRQHEELDYHHQFGEAKFLERPFNEHQGELQAIIAAEIGRSLK